MFNRKSSVEIPASKVKPMTVYEVGELAGKVEFWSHQISGDAVPADHGWTVTVVYRGETLEFNFDHSGGDEANPHGRQPDATDVISALWAHTSKVRRGEVEFYKSFGNKASAKEMWAEWKRHAAWCVSVFGKEFGR